MSNLGRFVWYDLLTNDQEGSEKFYSDLHGWNIKSIDMGEQLGTYRMVHVGEQPIGGMVKMDGDSPAPAHWYAYVAVDDVDAATERATNLGGQVFCPPMDIPNVGRFAIIADSAGAVIAPYKDATEYAPEMTPPVPPGHFAWNELLTHDIEKSNAFYTELFGWGHKSQDMGAWTYHMFTRPDGKEACGMMQMPPESKAPSHWLPYIAVDDVDAKTAALVEAGGKTWNTMDIPGVGKFSVNQDPQGAAIAYYKAPSAPADC